MRRSENDDSWKKILDPQKLRTNLISMSLFVSTFEMFKDHTISRLIDFYMDPRDLKEMLSKKDVSEKIVSERYKQEVLSKYEQNALARFNQKPKKKNKRPKGFDLYATLFWFQDMGAIEITDIDTFDEIRKHRNDVVHKMFRFIGDADRNLNPDMFVKLVELFSKIEVWWIKNIELEINPYALPADTNPEDINDDEISPGSMMMLRLILDIALGQEPREGYYYQSIFSENNEN